MDRPLHTPSAVRDLLRKHGLRPDRNFGQNFLVDLSALQAIAAAAEVGSDDTVLEVGPGLGVLTAELARRAARVVAVELDARLLPVLEETVGGFGNVEVRHEDAVEFDYAALPRGSLLVANLPYNVATPVLARALEAGVFERLVVMVQREVADRLTAGAGEEAFGALSLLVAHYGSARTVRLVSPGCFYPPPEVTSAVVRIDTRPDAAPDPELFLLIRDAFRHRRKTLKKNLVMAGYPPDLVDSALAQAGLDPRVRAEALSLPAFRNLRSRLQRSV